MQKSYPFFNCLKSHVFFSVGLCAALFLSSCSNPFESKKEDGPKRPQVEVYARAELKKLVAEGNIVVVDENLEPVRDAQVLFGNALNDPFPGNYLQVDQNGVLPIPSAWKGEATVTVNSVGFMRQSYLDLQPQGQLFKMKRLILPNNFEVNGLTTGHALKDKDDWLDVGLVMVPLSKEDLMTFDISKIISPLTETITVVGRKVEVPGNITIPKQKENYIIPITIEKPLYRISFSRAGDKSLYGLRAQFPFKKVIKELSSNTPFYDLVNYFSFLSSTTQSTNLTSPVTKLDLNLSDQLLNQKLSVQAPVFAEQQVMVSVLAMQMDGKWLPTDVKKFESAQAKVMSAVTLENTVLVSVLKNKSEFDFNAPGFDRLSAVVKKAQEKENETFLPLIKDPRIVSSDEAELSLPATVPVQLQRLGSYAAVNALIRTKDSQGKVSTEVRKQWEFYGQGWKEKIRLPLFPARLRGLDSKDRRLEVMYIGSTDQRLNTEKIGTEFMEDATHITRSSVDF